MTWVRDLDTVQDPAPGETITVAWGVGVNDNWNALDGVQLSSPTINSTNWKVAEAGHPGIRLFSQGDRVLLDLRLATAGSSVTWSDLSSVAFAAAYWPGKDVEALGTCQEDSSGNLHPFRLTVGLDGSIAADGNTVSAASKIYAQLAWIAGV